MRPILLALFALLLASNAAPSLPQGGPIPGMVRVRIETSAGAIVVALDAKHAPRTTANFLAYVDDGRFEGTTFYRAARRKGAPQFGFVQGGIGTDQRRTLGWIPIEPTNVTGLRHLDATLSMAHGPDPNSATGNFSIMVGANPGLDARGNSKGFAAFGRVIAGMDVVRRMLAMPTGGGRDDMKDQMILKPVTILGAKRLDGTPRPTGMPKAWQLVPKR
ncbi:peptidylprolyl isomerase [Sphingomonas sp.]|uniref:peptidylprolyl isomerase n=1 Tax=Sphingomonas sp. TaxID=28214 RepID=UPI001B0CB987|nr:peptidylprolyl isomerase [Sphingomonas sp.]MBO9713457.1 peptidylprolyl isomerase [Sphingomonas sp.]